MRKWSVGVVFVSVVLAMSGCHDRHVEQTDPISDPKNQVTLRQARVVAESCLDRVGDQDVTNARMASTSDTLKDIIVSRQVKDQEGNIVMYLISRKKRVSMDELRDAGSVLVSADRRIRPILAMSDSTSIQLDGDNPGLKIWLDYVMGAIADARKRQTKPTREADILWAKYLNEDKRTQDCADPPCPGDPCPPDFFYQSPVLTTTSWGQWGPYNMYCPSSNSPSCGACAKATAGCAAVAAAQIMNIYKKPATYTIPPAGPVNYVYPLEPSLASTCNSNNVRVKEVAALIRACGMWQNTDYAFNKCNSFTWRENIKNAFASAGYSNAGTRMSWVPSQSVVNAEIQGDIR